MRGWHSQDLTSCRIHTGIGYEISCTKSATIYDNVSIFASFLETVESLLQVHFLFCPEIRSLFTVFLKSDHIKWWTILLTPTFTIIPPFVLMSFINIGRNFAGSANIVVNACPNLQWLYSILTMRRHCNIWIHNLLWKFHKLTWICCRTFYILLEIAVWSSPPLHANVWKAGPNRSLELLILSELHSLSRLSVTMTGTYPTTLWTIH